VTGDGNDVVGITQRELLLEMRSDLKNLTATVDSIAWGSKTPIRSCDGAVVLVDEPTEQGPLADIARVNRDRLPGRCERRGEAEGTVRPPAAVVLSVGPQRPVEVPPPPG
jgi:hypothetical protein